MTTKLKIPGKLYRPKEILVYRDYKHTYLILRETHTPLNWKTSKIRIDKFLQLFPNPVLYLGQEEFVETEFRMDYQIYVRKDDVPWATPKTWKMCKFWDGETYFYMRPSYVWMLDEVD